MRENLETRESCNAVEASTATDAKTVFSRYSSRSKCLTEVFAKFAANSSPAMDKYEIARTLDDWLANVFGVSDTIAIYLKLFVLLVILAVFCALSWYISKRIIVVAINRIFLKTKAEWDDALVHRGVFNKLAHIVPGIIINVAAPYAFGDFPEWIPAVQIGTDIFIVVIIVWSVNSVLTSISDILSGVKALKDKPLNSYSQLAKVIVFLIGAVLIFSMLIGQSPLAFLGAMGAATAVILLIFRDAILGFVASIQMSVYDMIRVGDWVSMPKYEADGDVLAINLTTVKVQNWDKTITTVPAYAFIQDSFKNWRGMSESGGRRIKRAMHIKISSIKFCDGAMIDRYSRIALIRDYVAQRQQEIETYNAKHEVDQSELINGRRMTNVGVFRHYAESYLRANPKLNKEMTMMVRQLEPTEKGLPLEIYCFSSDKAWVNYEGIIADIFDHLLAAIPAFELEIFEAPTGRDFQSLAALSKAAQQG